MSSGTSNHSQEQAAIEQKINEMVQQSRVLEAYMNDIARREATVARLIEEAHLASTALQSLTSDSEAESLMPVGIGVYIKASIPPLKKLLVNVGAGITVEKSREDALNYIESKIKEFDVASRQLANQRQQIAGRMDQIQNQINYLLQQASQQPVINETGRSNQ